MNENDLQPYDLLPKFVHMKCPKCGQRFVQIDRFGLFCTFRNCDWRKESAEEIIKEKHQKD